MCHFYLQWPPSHKHFDPWDVKHLLSLLECLEPASSLTTFKLAWRTATLLALVTVKHCSDLTLLCIDNQHLFLWCHAAIFIPMSGGKTDCLGHLPTQIYMESHTNVNFCPVFIWRLILNHLGWSLMDCTYHLFFWITIGSTGPVCAKTIPSWVRKVLSVAKPHVSRFCLGAAASAALVAGVSLVSILEAGDWDRVSTLARH